MNKTPLQQWQWDRFRLHGVVRQTGSLYKAIQQMEFISDEERAFLEIAKRTMEKILSRKELNDIETRERAENG